MRMAIKWPIAKYSYQFNVEIPEAIMDLCMYNIAFSLIIIIIIT